MSEVIKTALYYWNGLSLAVSNLYFSLFFLLGSISVSIYGTLPERLDSFIKTIGKPIAYLYDSSLAKEIWREETSVLYVFIAFGFLLFAAITTLIFFRKQLTTPTTVLISVNFLLPIIIYLINTGIADYIEDNDLFAYIFLIICGLAFLAYCITTLIFMFKDADELD